MTAEVCVHHHCYSRALIIILRFRRSCCVSSHGGIFILTRFIILKTSRVTLETPIRSVNEFCHLFCLTTANITFNTHQTSFQSVTLTVWSHFIIYFTINRNLFQRMKKTSIELKINNKPHMIKIKAHLTKNDNSQQGWSLSKTYFCIWATELKSALSEQKFTDVLTDQQSHRITLNILFQDGGLMQIWNKLINLDYLVFYRADGFIYLYNVWY